MTQKKKQVAEAFLRRQYPFIRGFKYLYRIHNNNREVPVISIDMGRPDGDVDFFAMRTKIERFLFNYFLMPYEVRLVPKYIIERNGGRWINPFLLLT
jgi:hypothetical protein